MRANRRSGSLMPPLAPAHAPDGRIAPFSLLLYASCAAVGALLAVSAAAAPAFAQSDACAALQSALRQTYGFDPTQLSDQQRAAKSKALQEFWEDAKGLGAPAVPCLRQMLASDTQDPFFLYNGSLLLFSLDTSPSSTAAISTALAGADPQDVDAAQFIGLLIKLARLDVDIGPLAAKYLNYESLHSDTQGPNAFRLFDVALLLYGSMQPLLAEKYLEGLAQYGEPNARSAAVFALALNLTEPAFRALHAGVSLAGLPDDNRNIVLSIFTYQQMTAAPHTPLSRDEVLKRLDSVIRGDFAHIDAANPPYVSGDQAFAVSAGAQLTPADIPRLLEARRMSIRGVSDDSLAEYTTLTRIIIEVINRYNLYKKWRVVPAYARKSKP
jgi:hypothetical protein